MGIRERLESLFNDRSAAGVYLIDTGLSVDALADITVKNHYLYVHINGMSTTNKDSFLHTFAEKMNFPSYFGKNWDAFEECLRDLEWLKADGYILVYENFQFFAENDPTQFEIALDIFRSSVDYWQDQGIQMYILLMENISASKTVLTIPNLPNFL